MNIENDLFFTFKYNEREITGIEEFKTELENQYNFQGKGVYIAAASEGTEMFFDFFINSDVTEFAKSIVVSGLLWDLIKVGTKKYVFEPFFKALEKLNANNKNTFGNIKIVCLKMHFDDCEIIIGGLTYQFTAILSSIFQEILKKKNKFEEDADLPLSKIELPIFYKENVDKKGCSPYILDTHIQAQDYRIEYFKKLWKLSYMNNFEVKIYDFDKNQYSPAYPN